MDMDLELVLTTILTWMRVQVSDASPWVKWPAAAYAVYWFFRGNWVTLRDFARAVHWVAGSPLASQRADKPVPWTGLPALAGRAAAWLRKPSKYALLAERCKTLEERLEAVAEDVYEDEPVDPNGARREDTVDMPLPPIVTADNKQELERKIAQATGAGATLAERKAADRERAQLQAELHADVAKAKRQLDGGTTRGQGNPIIIGHNQRS